MTDHPSHPDLLMSRMLGVCWHSPTSDRWPCKCGLCGHLEEQHSLSPGCGVGECDCDFFEGPEAPCEPTTRCDGDPVECNCEAALGEAEGKLQSVRELLAFLNSNDPLWRDRYERYFLRAMGDAK